VEWITTLIDLFVHLDRHLGQIISDYGTWTYLILFAIIFCETGLVVTPFLPGDSLLFAAGSFAALPAADAPPGGSAANVLSPHLLFLVLSAAAIIGDTVNYWIGAYVGPRAFSGEIRFLKKEYLDRTHAFYERHGGKTIILARFVPIIRTFAPFVAGIGAMSYGRFITYNVVGGVTWVAGFVYAGYYFGTRPFVQRNFAWVIAAIIVISVMPVVVEYLRARRAKARAR